jgi:hypothetical protein
MNQENSPATKEVQNHQKGIGNKDSSNISKIQKQTGKLLNSQFTRAKPGAFSISVGCLFGTSGAILPSVCAGCSFVPVRKKVNLLHFSALIST